jgi:hypothetical protein
MGRRADVTIPNVPAETQIRLVPEGCDYVLRGVGHARADRDELPVRAIAPGGNVVVARIPIDAPGLIMLEGTAPQPDEVLIQLKDVFVPAASVGVLDG